MAFKAAMVLSLPPEKSIAAFIPIILKIMLKK
jgi:hypothetical protein